MKATTGCQRCGRPFSRKLADAAGWNGFYLGGVLQHLVCPGCQTADENIEAEVADAMTSNSLDAFGRSVSRPKAVQR